MPLFLIKTSNFVKENKDKKKQTKQSQALNVIDFASVCSRKALQFKWPVKRFKAAQEIFWLHPVGL